MEICKKCRERGIFYHCLNTCCEACEHDCYCPHSCYFEREGEEE